MYALIPTILNGFIEAIQNRANSIDNEKLWLCRHGILNL
jgi:hypothetical protein